jgi:hypothetical protein
LIAKLNYVCLSGAELKWQYSSFFAAIFHFGGKIKTAPARCWTVLLHNHILKRLTAVGIFLKVNAAFKARRKFARRKISEYWR